MPMPEDPHPLPGESESDFAKRSAGDGEWGLIAIGTMIGFAFVCAVWCVWNAL